MKKNICTMQHIHQQQDLYLISSEERFQNVSQEHEELEFSCQSRQGYLGKEINCTSLMKYDYKRICYKHFAMRIFF